MRFFANPEPLPEDKVVLKPLFGLKPEKWLFCVFCLAVTAVLFFLLVFPWIVKPGSLVSFTSEPEGAAVRSSGVYIGQTPCEAFVRKGSSEITMTMPGFGKVTEQHNTGSRIFASLFFPRREKIAFSMTEERPLAALTEGARDFAAWSFTSEPTEAYQIPMPLSTGAYRGGGGASAAALEIIKASARFTQTRASLKDLIRALCIIKSEKGVLSPFSLTSSIDEALNFLSDNKETALWLSAVLNGGAKDAVLSSEWYAVSAANGTALPPAPPSVAPLAAALPSVTAGGVLFEPVSNGLFAAASLITDAQFAQFTGAEPKWDAANKAELAALGLVTDGYLTPVDDPRYPFPAAGAVSAFAAEAYCEWLSARLPAAFSGWEVRLPSETEWDVLSRSPKISGIGSIWEWCASPYAPYTFKADSYIIEEIGSPERTVRGGSFFARPRGAEKAFGRGSIPAESSTPFTGFRPVLVRNE